MDYMIYQAHKGVSTEYPENTMPAVVAAVEQGYGIVEMDIGVTKDLKFVLLHDDFINRTGRYPNGEEIEEKIAVGDLTYEELQAYDFGVRNGEKFKGTKAPLFEDVLKYAQSVKIPIKIDNKYQKMNEMQKKAFFELLTPYVDVACLTCGDVDAIKEALEFFPEMCFHYDGIVSEEHLAQVSELVPKERLTVWLAHKNEHTHWVKVPYADEELAKLVKKYATLGVWILSTEEQLMDAMALGAEIIETNGQLKP